jgi:uncharacterized membrane protein YkoI
MTLSKNTRDLLHSWKLAQRAIAVTIAVVFVVAASAPLHAAVIALEQAHELAPRQSDRDPVAAMQREAFRLRTAETTLSRAMEIALERHAGARVVDVSFDGTAASPIFRVLTATGNQIVEDHVNASTGAIDDSSVFSELKDLDEVDRRNVRSLLRNKLSLSDAVRVAEKKTSGIALGAGLLRVEGSLRFGVVVLSGDRLRQVILDPPRPSKVQ